jgi:diguanylate cyclase (GGDEF)-like protein
MSFRKQDLAQLGIFIAGLLLVLLVGALDYSTGPNFPCDLFYLAPILLVTWFDGAWGGVGIAVLAIFTSAVCERLAGGEPGDLALTVWHTVMESGIFLVFLVLLAKLRDQARRLGQLAAQDALTGVENRRSFYRATQIELNRCRRYARPFALAYIDIDNFKVLNDTQGHSAGDKLLREVALALHRHTRNVDTVGRMGGDEFAILLPETDAEGARTVLNRTHEHLSELAARHGWPTTFSIGVVAFSETPADIDDVVGLSDRVMYTAKKRGKDNVAFEVWPAEKVESASC